MEYLFFQEVLRLDGFLFNRCVFHELFPYFIGGEGSPLMQELGYPEVSALADILISDDINDLSGRPIHFCDYNY